MAADLLDSVENSIWHAFDFLALEGDGTATKLRLKTLTAEIGKILELQDVDNGLDDYRSTTYLTFEQYRYYLFKEVFSALPDEMTIEDQQKNEAKVDETCWEVCKTNYLERDNPLFPDDCVYMLFRIFSMLGDMVENDKGMPQIVMAASEVENAAYRFMSSLGQGADWDAEEFDSVVEVIPTFTFAIFVTVFESKYAKDVDEGGMRESVRDIHDYFVRDVIKKGYMGKKMDLLPAFREHFFVLQPQQLAMFGNTSEKETRGEIAIDGQCRVEAVPDSRTKSPLKTPGSKHHSKFQLFAAEKTYEFQATDHRTRLQWINALRTAIEYAGEPIRYQRALLEKRQFARQEEKEREEEEHLRKASHADSLDQTKIQLEYEKQGRIVAEEHAATLQRQRVIEDKKMRELEKIREQLEIHLEEEKSAKKDEEIVRQLQARVLEEEWGRREQLEKLQEEQRIMLEQERKKREDFEKEQQEKERQLREAQKLVEDMEKERRKLDKQLDIVQEKTKRAYLSQEILEAKMKLQEHERNIEIDKEASRTSTLNPSASFYVRNNSNGDKREGRPSYMPMRSASMRETSYSRSIRRSRMRPPSSNNDSTLSVANTTNSEMMMSPNIAIDEVNSNGSNSEEAIEAN
jgi:hypothetical protein